MTVWLSVFCCQLFDIPPSDIVHTEEAVRKGLIIVPPEHVSVVRNMTLHGRRRWFLAKTDGVVPTPAPG